LNIGEEEGPVKKLEEAVKEAEENPIKAADELV